MQIRVSTNDLKQAAERLKNLCEELGAINSQITKQASNLTNAWEGKSATEARNEINSIANNIRGFTDELQESAYTLVHVAQAFEQAEGINNTYFIVAVSFEKRNFTHFVLPPLNGVVRIIPDEVREVATACQAIGEEVSGLARTYNSIIADLQSVWEGNSATLFVQQAQEAVPTFAYFADSIAAFANEIRQAAAKYEELDNSFSAAQ